MRESFRLTQGSLGVHMDECWLPRQDLNLN